LPQILSIRVTTGFCKFFSQDNRVFGLEMSFGEVFDKKEAAFSSHHHIQAEQQECD